MIKRSTWWIVILSLTGCTPDGESPTSVPAGRIASVNGASVPVLRAGQAIVIEGSGFGTALGDVRFVAAGGVPLPAIVRTEDWTDRFIHTAVPEGAVTGLLQVVPRTADAIAFGYVLQARRPLAPGEILWQEGQELPFLDARTSVTLAQDFTTGVLQSYLIAAITPTGGDSTHLFAGFVSDGRVTRWDRRTALPQPRASPALIVATPHTTRLTVPRLYVAGGVDSTGTPMSTVVSAEIGLPDVEFGPFDIAASLPRALDRPRITAGLGTLYATGGVTPNGVASRDVFVAHVRSDGVLEGWFVAPRLPEPRYAHGALLQGSTLLVMGGGGTAPSDAAIDTTGPRFDTAVEATVSGRSGFFTTSSWSAPAPALPAGRSRFALLPFDEVVLIVGGVYPGAATGSGEILAASIVDGLVGPFVSGTAANSIASLGGGHLVDPFGLAWYDADGRPHAAILAGRDLVTGGARRAVWGF